MLTMRNAVPLLVAAMLNGIAGAEQIWQLGDVVPAEKAGVPASRTIVPNLPALNAVQIGDVITMPVDDDTDLQGHVKKIRRLGPARVTVAGSVTDSSPSSFVLARNGTGLAGFIQINDGTLYRLLGHSSGAIRLEMIDSEKLIGCSLGKADAAPDFDIPKGPAGAGAAAGGEPCDDGSLIDVLVPFSSQARSEAGGTDNMLAEIDLLIAAMNESLAYSELSTQVRLVHAQEFHGIDDITLSQLTNNGDGIADGVHALRDAYKADQVALVVSGGGGVANGLWEFDPAYEAEAFCKNGRETAPFIIAHEVGHNLGCCHALGDGGGCPAQGGLLFLYSNGHRFFGNSGTLWRSVMAYEPGEWSAFYSNPQVTFDGVPTGIPKGSSDAADNALTIQIAAPLVATWRCSDTVCFDLNLPPNAPDCNGNDVPDACEIARGELQDADGDGIPDICDCDGDVDQNGEVDVADLLQLLAQWGPCSGCPTDLDGNSVVNVTDLLTLLANWGDC